MMCAKRDKQFKYTLRYMDNNYLQTILTMITFKDIINILVIALIVIFQNEIRFFFHRVGSRVGHRWVLGKKRLQQTELNRVVAQLNEAILNMSMSYTGALIVIAGQQDLSEYTDTGKEVDAKVSAPLIENIFFRNTPLHDGALLIMDGRIQSAACILPVSGNKDLPLDYGLRHRAALGLTEKTDATAIVVSEETGRISIAQGSTLRTIEPDQLKAVLSLLFFN